VTLWRFVFSSQTGHSARSLAIALAILSARCGGCAGQRQGGEEARAAEGRPTTETVRPVYETAGTVEPLAVRLCQALYALPEERRAACCASRAGVVLAEACAGVLSAALRSESLGLESARLEACTGALARVYAGCEWVGPFGPPFPQECQGLLTGRRALGEACRSSLECAGGLRCAGAGPTDAGRCSPPGEQGDSCGTAVDALATYTRQDVDTAHPQCQGLCRRHRCEAVVAAGAACETSPQCGVGKRCAAGRCSEGLAEEGQSCSGGGCAAGLRCLKGKCLVPLGAGAACSTDFECRGGCLAGARRCGMRCDLR
jgi:hypothetical protein